MDIVQYVGILYTTYGYCTLHVDIVQYMWILYDEDKVQNWSEIHSKAFQFKNYCQAATKMIVTFLMYDNKLFCVRYIYKYDSFCILMFIVT